MVPGILPEILVNRSGPGDVLARVRPPSSDDAAITEWARLPGRGDRVALERFLRATQSHVWRFVAGLSDPQSADDLTQETYVRALGSLGRFRAESSARTWLLSIARRVVADHIRALQARPRSATLADWQSAGQGTAPAEHTAFEERLLLDHLVAALDPDRRAAFVLTQTLGLSYTDAAEVCGCPVGTIRSRVARARDDLMAAMHDTTVRPSATG